MSWDIGRFSRHGRDLDEDVWKVCIYRYDSDTLDWVRWDGKVDTVVNGDLNVAVDDLEQYVLDQRLQYLYSGVLEDGGNTYVGYEDKAGLYYIVKYDSNGDPGYAAGSGGIPDKGTAANWTGLSYGSVMATF